MKKISLSEVEWQGRFNYQKTILLNETDFESQGTKLQLIKLAAGQAIELHYHKTRTEAFCVLAGHGFIRLNDNNFDCQPNDFLFCPPHTVHGFQNTSDQDLIISVFRTNDPGDSDMFWVDTVKE